MRSFLVAACLAVVACDSTPRPQTDMERWARAALKCPVGALNWSVVEPNGGTVDQLGNYNAPGCPVPYADATYHVQVTGCGNTIQIPIDVKDTELQSLTVYCGVVSPETCCRLPPWTVGPSGSIQMYARFTYSCAGHIAWSSPTPPPALCP